MIFSVLILVKWLCIRKCSLGDTGLCYLTKPLINLPFQVLILESCGLTDKACPMLSSVLRAHEASRDVMAWNAFLRASPEELRSAEAWSERSHIQSSGLMLVSIKGNLVTSSGICRLLEAVRTSCWLLGLKLSSNQISRRGILNFLDGLSEHCGLAALVLDNNPGFSECMRSRVADKLNRSSSVCIPDACHALLQRWKSRQTGLSTPSGDFVGTGSATMTSTPVTSRSTSEGKVYAFIDPPTSGEVVFDSDEALTPHSSDAMNRKPINQEKVTATEVEIAAIITPQQNESEEFTEAEKIAVQAALRAKILQYMHDRTY